MNRNKKLSVFLLATLLLSVSCQKTVPSRNRTASNDLPRIILWAWERPEDLEFLDPERFGVAFLAQTLVIEGDTVRFQPRRQPLKVSPKTKLIAVTRIESTKTTGKKANLGPSQRSELVALIHRTLELENVAAVQVDFDVVQSEREAYRALLEELRQRLPVNVGLSMTALASFCIGDRWLRDMPVDEAVPMIFRMGTDNDVIKSLLARGKDFGEPLCRTSYGIALDEPLKMEFDSARRLYVFNNHAWTKDDILRFQ